jgi:hypothetical protein
MNLSLVSGTISVERVGHIMRLEPQVMHLNGGTLERGHCLVKIISK